MSEISTKREAVAMSAVDTRTEVVEWLVYGCENYHRDWLLTYGPKIAATLRALLDERDAAVARAERWDTEAAAARVIISRLETERDAARAEVARLRDILTVLLSVMPVFPATARQIVGMEDRYNAAIEQARAALAGGSGDE